MANETVLDQLQHSVSANFEGVEVICGDCSSTYSAATCLLKLNSKLAKVHIAARLVKGTLRIVENPQTDDRDHKADQNALTSGSTAKLARFLAELSPAGYGSFDTGCLVTQNAKPASLDCNNSPSKQEQPLHKGQQSSILQAILQEASSSSRARQLDNQWLSPTVALFSSSNTDAAQHLCLVHRPENSLGDALRFSPSALQDDSLCRLILFQVLSCLQCLHRQGLCIGHLTPDTVCLSPDRHVWVDFSAQPPGKDGAQQDDLQALTAAWCSKRMSNLDYLLHLNRLAGRRLGDRTFHPFLPWALDMTQPPEPGLQEECGKACKGWRDLTRTKWRLSKGDEQLDFTYQSAPEPHHISDEAMSELAVCIYKARRLPKEVLVSVVRPQFHPQEYPASLTRLYKWSPDEAIPDFYTNPSVFESIHPELLDLAVPDWASSAEDFVTRHRTALESERVSDQLHKWIDLNFGYKLSGQAAVDAKNVALPAADPTALTTTGRVQLFHRPHPPRYAQACNLLATEQVKQLSHLQQLDLLEAYTLSRPTAREDTEAAAWGPSGVTPAIRCDSPESPESPDSPLSESVTSLQAVPPGQQQSNVCEKGRCEDDIHAVGRLIVQLFRGRMIHHQASDHRFWGSEVGDLPWAARPLAAACLHPNPTHRPTAAALLDCDFFPQPVRTAAFFLAALHPPRAPITGQWDPLNTSGSDQRVQLTEQAPWLIDEATGCSPLAALAARAASGELAALQAQPDALSLCLPGCINILSSTLSHLTQPSIIFTAGGHLATPDPAAPVKGHSAVVQHWCSVVRVLLDMLSKAQIEGQLRLLLERPFTAQHGSAVAAICVALLQLMPTLFDKLGLDVYMTYFHPHVMHMIVTSANQPWTPGSSSQSTTSSQIAASFERAQMTNAASTALCGVVGNKLTLPVVLEHVIRPLLLALGNSPDVAVALIGVGGAIGGPMTALHVLPCLTMVLISSSVSDSPGGSAQQRVPARRRLSESGKGGAGAMLNAVTALEGLLPILPAEAIRQQMVKARQVVVQAAMLAEAPSLSAAAAGGPAEETQPSLLADMLLSPLHHPLATPQLRDRLAALLLQASKLVGGSEMVALELLPQLVPLFLCPPDQRAAYGSSIPPAAPSATPSTPPTIRSSASMATASSGLSSSDSPVSLQQRMQQALTADIAPSGAPRNMPNPLLRQGPGSGLGLGSGPGSEGGNMREEDTGFWDLVYILYPDFAEATGVGSLRELVPHWSLLERTLMARYAWAPPAFNPNLTSSSSSGLLASLKDKVKRIRRTTSGTSVTSPLAYPTRPPQPYAAPPQEDDQSQRAALYIQGIGWSTPAAVSPRRAPAGSGAVGSSPLGRQSSIMPDWSVAEDANTDQVGVDAGNGATRGQDEGDEGQEQGGSVQGILEGSAVRPGADLDAESSVNSLLGSALEGGLSPLLMEHEMGGSGLMNPPNARRWHWLPISPDDNPLQWAHADIWERYPLPGDEEEVFWQRPWRLRAAVVYGWRAHRQRLTAIAVHPNEHLVATAGRGHVGGQDQEVVRCWNLADAAAGVQYTGHSSPVTALCWLPFAQLAGSTTSLMASCDASGALHIWSAASGAGRLAFREPPSNPPSAESSTTPVSAAHAAPSDWMQHPSMYRAQPRGLAALRTSSSGSGSASHTHHPVTAATAVEGSSKSSSSLASALAQRPPGGYTALAGGHGGCGEGKDLVAGTGNGRARWIDVDKGMLKADMYCRPLSTAQAGGGAVSALATGVSHVAAGLTSGHAAVLDARSCSVAGFWKGHDASITHLALIDAHQVLTSSPDHTLKLWDLRMSHDALHVDSINSNSYPRTVPPSHAQTDKPASKQLTAGGPGCLAVFSGHTEAVSGFAIQQRDVIAHAGGHLGVLSLHGPPYVQQFVPTRLSNARGGKDSAAFVGMAVLPHSRLLVAGTEDGVIKICH